MRRLLCFWLVSIPKWDVSNKVPMSKNRVIVDAVHAVAILLLVVYAYIGPAGPGDPAAFASTSKACDVLCPCAKTEHDNPAGKYEGHVEADPCDDGNETDSGNEEGDPCRDKCPDDCPNCSCCLGVAVAVLPLSETSSAGSCISARAHAILEEPPSGVRAGIFRPPRSLS